MSSSSHIRTPPAAVSVGAIWGRRDEIAEQPTKEVGALVELLWLGLETVRQWLRFDNCVVGYVMDTRIGEHGKPPVGPIYGKDLPCVRPTRYFHHDFPRFSPQFHHSPMKPPSRPTDATYLPNEAKKHLGTALSRKSISESPSQLCSNKFVHSN